MKESSRNAARWFGLIMIVLIAAWDIDAMRLHIAAHSWDTLAFVSLFLIVHVSNYLTVGQLMNHIDPSIFQNAASASSSEALPVSYVVINLAAVTASARDSRHGWRKLFPLQWSQPSLLSGPSPARLYTFTAVTPAAAQASGSPYPVTRQHLVVEPE
jgi:hypothetical protein